MSELSSQKPDPIDGYDDIAPPEFWIPTRYSGVARISSYKYGIVELANQLHQYCTGSSEILVTLYRRDRIVYNALRYVEKTWHCSNNSRFNRSEAAVLELIRAVIQEYEYVMRNIGEINYRMELPLNP